MNTKLTKTKKALLGLLLVTASAGINAQEKAENVVPRIGGFGMKFSILGLDDLGFTSNAGGKVFFASINGSKNFRFEPEFGFAKSSTPNTNLGRLESKGSHFGGSMYYMFQRGHTNIYLGPTVSVNKFSRETEEYVGGTWSTPGTYKKGLIESKGVTYGMIVGGEYFFNRHFSLGAETGCMSNKYNFDITKTEEDKSFYTSGNLVVRAYF